MNKNGLEIFDMLALFSIVTGLYNMSLNESHTKEQEENEDRLKRIEEKLNALLKNEG